MYEEKEREREREKERKRERERERDKRREEKRREEKRKERRIGCRNKKRFIKGTSEGALPFAVTLQIFALKSTPFYFLFYMMFLIGRSPLSSKGKKS